jgi:hypothetical protein
MNRRPLKICRGGLIEQQGEDAGADRGKDRRKRTNLRVIGLDDSQQRDRMR